MKFETSSTISTEAAAEIAKKLRKAAVESKNDKFFGPNEKIDVVTEQRFPSVDELATRAQSGVPKGDPTLCSLAYGAAKVACKGDVTCEAIAFAAYQICLHS